MPLVTITLREGRGAEEKRRIGDVIQAALVAAGVPETDRFQEFFELKPENWIVDPRYPDLAADRDGDLVMIRVLWSVGRTPKVKRGVIQAIVNGLRQRLGIAPHNVFIAFVETTWENWSMGGGVQPYA